MQDRAYGVVWRRARLVVLIFCTAVALLFAFYMLMEYQIVQGEEYAKRASNNYQSIVGVEASRGEIVDRYGRPLVTNRLSLKVMINQVDISNAELNQLIATLIRFFEQRGVSWNQDFPISITQPYAYLAGQEDRAASLRRALQTQDYATAQNCIDLIVQKCEISGLSAEETGKVAQVRGQMLLDGFSKQLPYTFAQDVDSALTSVLLELSDSLPGLSVSESYSRSYVDGTVAPHILGTVGPIYQEEAEKYKQQGYALDSIVGKSGIELAYEGFLHGTDGKRTVVKDEQGNVVDQYSLEEDRPQPGNTLVLSLDRSFQKAVQDATASFVLGLRHSSFGATKGAGVAVLDVKTGDPLALVTYPGYDINDYYDHYSELAADQRYKPLFNRVLMGTYRPGSTFKTCMSVAGLTEKVITERTYFNCSNPFNYYGTPFNCLQNRHSGPTNLYTALQYSCNIFFYNTGDRLGIDKINEYAHALGLGTDTGLEIASETGHISSPEYCQEHGLRWEQGYVVQTAIGQSETMVTPLQMAASMMTIANRGVRYETHLVRSILAYDYSRVVQQHSEKVASQLPDQNNAYAATTEGMKRMASTIAALRGLDVAVKSGTPEFYQNGAYKTNSAAVGFYPASNPEIAIGLMIEEGGNAPNLIKSIVDAYEASKRIQMDTSQPVNQLLTAQD